MFFINVFIHPAICYNSSLDKSPYINGSEMGFAQKQTCL